MAYYLIMFKTLTQAIQAGRTLERAGITAVAMRPPWGISEGGCAFCVKVLGKSLTQALIVLNSAGIGYGQVYILHKDGRSGEVVM